MKNTRMWAFWRRVQYGTGYITFLSLVSLSVYFVFYYTPATCFDLAQNGDEGGVDCGGGCTRICAFTVTPPKVVWVKSFEIQPGQYNAVAYIENQNVVAGTPVLDYVFRLYDGAGLITERAGKTVLPANSTYPVFEGRVDTDGRVPTETTLEIRNADMWLPSIIGREQFKTVDLQLVEAGTRPKLNVKIENTDLKEAQSVEVVATIFDQSGIPLTSSQTYIDLFAGRSQKDIVFTWPNPIAKTVRSCAVPTDVVIAIDLSGSMNNDGNNPPEPVTSVLEAASAFASQLRTDDRVSVVTFATKATLNNQLTNNVTSVANAIKQLKIDPKEELGNTNPGDALILAKGELSSTRQNPDARKVVVLLTDGLATAPEKEPEEYAKVQADIVKSEDITVYTIGLGKSVNMDFLRTLASGSNLAYAAPTTGTLGSIYKNITDSICEDGAARIDVIPKVTRSFAPLE
ncbi:VWA domain-containing protein [Patescibacteria group bacterium]|nr:VWA domain-containing protein [Patescibacteria group bacterium]